MSGPASKCATCTRPITAGICPIETPEGPNIGLINSLATFARVNKYGFIESPYRRIVSGKVTNEVIYLSATEEAKYHVAQANAVLNDDGSFVEEFVVCRHAGDVMLAPRDSIDLMDRVAEAARFGCRGAHPVPGER